MRGRPEWLHAHTKTNKLMQSGLQPVRRILWPAGNDREWKGVLYLSRQPRGGRSWIWQSLKHTCVRVWGVCVFCPVAERIPGLSREGPPGETGPRAAARASSTFCTELTLGFEGGDMKATSWGNLSPVKVATFVSTLVAGYFGVARNHVAGSAPPHWPDRSSQ